MSELLRSGLAAALLALVHVFHVPVEARLRPFRHVWLPLSAGVAIGYVFLYLLPKMARYSAAVGGGAVDTQLYAWALAGLLVFYVVDRRRARRTGTGDIRDRWVQKSSNDTGGASTSSHPDAASASVAARSRPPGATTTATRTAASAGSSLIARHAA